MMETAMVTIAVLLRILSNPLGNVFQKQLTAKGIHPLFVNFLTYFLLSVFCIVAIFFFNLPEVPRQFWIYSVLAGMTGALGNGFLVKAINDGELSVLGPVNSYKSVVGIIGGIILLGEIPSLWGIAGIVLIIYGSYFVLDTTEERFSFALLKRSDIQFRLIAMILTAIEAVFLKKVIIASSSTIAFLSWCCFGALFSFILLFVYRLDFLTEVKKTSLSDTRKFVLLIACIGTMQFTTNFTFEHMPVGYSLSLFQLSAIVSVFFGYRFFKERDIRKKLLGSFIMIIGSVIVFFLK
ncbi:MAG: EamA family transporter [Bacteroidales bacterium]|nr:EamA family transporter [Bacteroidales bacterium]